MCNGIGLSGVHWRLTFHRQQIFVTDRPYQMALIVHVKKNKVPQWKIFIFFKLDCLTILELKCKYFNTLSSPGYTSVNHPFSESSTSQDIVPREIVRP